MGLLDAFKRKKSSDDDLLNPGLGQPTGLDLGPMPNAGPPTGIPASTAEPGLGDIGGFSSPGQPSAFQDNQQHQQMQPNQQSQQVDLVSQKLDVITGKLDIIKNCLDNINQRLSTLEQMANEGKKGRW